MRMPVLPPGVPTPYAVHVHPYPTRFHGGQWKRPVFGLPRVQSVSSVFQPNQMRPSPGSGELFAPVSGLGSSPDGLGSSGCGCSGPQYRTHSGVFRRPRSGGGGVFNRAISGDGDEKPSENETPIWAYFLAGGAVAFFATLFYLEDHKR